MANPTTRATLKSWCLRKLGEPVIKINVSDDQVEDRIDEALQYFAEYHYDAIEKVYTPYLLTASDITNKYIALDDDMVSVTNIFPLYEDGLSANIFDVRYQARLSDVQYFNDTFLQYYNQTKQYINLVNEILSPNQSIRFNRHTDRLYIDAVWGADLLAGNYIILEGWRTLDPETYGDIYNDRFLKQYITALIKQQWGSNLSKFDNIQLPGGVTFNGQQIYDQATTELESIRETMISQNEEPPMFFMA